MSCGMSLVRHRWLLLEGPFILGVLADSGFVLSEEEDVE